MDDAAAAREHDEHGSWRGRRTSVQPGGAPTGGTAGPVSGHGPDATAPEVPGHRADVEEALVRLGLRPGGAPGDAGPWGAESDDGTPHEVTAVEVGTTERWEMLRTRTTALLALEHENVVPLVAAMPVGDPTAPAPRTLVLVWLRPQPRTPAVARVVGDGSDEPEGTATEVVDLLVVACRATVALRSCGIDVPGEEAVAALLGGAGAGGGPAQLHPWRWCVRAGSPVGEPHDVTRAITGAVARHAESIGLVLPRGVGTLLASGSGGAAPSPGDLAARALALRGVVVPKATRGDVSPEGGARAQEATYRVEGAPRAAGTAAPRAVASRGEWRALVRDGAGPEVVMPPQARRSGAARTVTIRPQAGAPSRRRRPAGVVLSAPVPRSALPRPVRRRQRRVARRALGASLALVVVGTAGILAHRAFDGSAPENPAAGRYVPSPTVAPAGAPAHGGRAPGPAAVVPEAGAPDAHEASSAEEQARPSGPGDPAAAAARATVGRVDVLAALTAVPEADVAARAAAVDALLAEHVAPGPVRDADRELVERVLRGGATSPQVRAEVTSTEVLGQDPTSATVAVTYVLVPGGGQLRHTLRLTLAAGVWKVVSADEAAAPGAP